MLISKLSTNEINHILKLTQNNNENDAIGHLKRMVNKCHWTEIVYKQTGDSILHYAARNGLANVVNFILKNFDPKSVDFKNKDDKTSLHEASQFSQFHICDILLCYGADVNALKRGDWTPLMLACTKSNYLNNIKTVEILIANGAIVNYKNKDGWSVLHLIAREGDEQMLQLLIENGLNVKMKTKNGRSALHIAALHGHLKMVKILLNLGLDVNEKDKCGNTPICEAVLGNHLAVCQKLISNKADSSIINISGFSLIHLAAFEGHIEMIQFILNELSVDINFVNKNNLTALHCAARKNKVEAYNFLLKNGASENVIDNFSRTPSDYLN